MTTPVTTPMDLSADEVQVINLFRRAKAAKAALDAATGQMDAVAQRRVDAQKQVNAALEAFDSFKQAFGG